jgi:hypothetical protein
MNEQTNARKFSIVYKLIINECIYRRIYAFVGKNESFAYLFLHGLQGSPGAFGSANFALAISRDASISALLW